MSTETAVEPIEAKRGLCWPLSPHRWTKWFSPKGESITELHARQYRVCVKCGRAQQHWVEGKIIA